MNKLPLPISAFEIPGCRVLIRYEKSEETLACGLILPEELRDEAQTYEGVGIVELKGDGRDISWKTSAYPRSVKTIWNEVHVGDRILFRKFLKDMNNLNSMFIEHIIDDEGEFFLIDIEDVLAILPMDIPVGISKTSGTKCYSEGSQK